jgi:hypothetical protein
MVLLLPNIEDSILALQEKRRHQPLRSPCRMRVHQPEAAECLRPSNLPLGAHVEST